MSVEKNEKPTELFEKPGAKLKMLRCELENQMAQRRSEIWQQKLHAKPVSENDDDIYDGNFASYKVNYF